MKANVFGMFRALLARCRTRLSFLYAPDTPLAYILFQIQIILKQNPSFALFEISDRVIHDFLNVNSFKTQ